MIEKTLEKLAIAIDNLANAIILSSTNFDDLRQSKIATEVKKPLSQDVKEDIKRGKVEEPKYPTLDEARTALKAFATKHGPGAAEDLLAKYNTAKLSGVPKDKRAEMIEACNE